MKKIIIFNPSDQRIIFLLAAAIKAGYTPTDGYKLEPLWEAEEIIFLNIDPNTGLIKLGANPDFDIFIDFKLNNIKAWLNFPGELDSSNPSVQNILKHFSLQMEINSLELNNPMKLLEKPDLARYSQALYAAKVVSVNTKNMRRYYDLFINMAHSLAKEQNSLNVDSFQMQYQRVLDSTENCFRRITINQTLIHLPPKEIAFGYLDNVSNYLDFSALRERCLNDYPFLTIIQYRQRGIEYNWLMSKGQLNIQRVFELPKNENNYELLITYPHKKMLLHLKKAIEGISRI
jgi:hypothetical protein